MAEKAKKLNKKKVTILIVFAVMLVIGAVGYIAMENPELFEKKEIKQPASMYSDKIAGYVFYEPNYHEDIFADEEYMGKNRYITYTNGAESFTVTDGNYARHGAPVAVLAQYIEGAVAGDAQAVNALFSDAYYEVNEPYERFTPQKIYDVEIEYLQSEEDGDDMLYAYDVDYKIMRNNGTFRNDIESDASRTLVFVLRESADGILIESVSGYSR